MGCGHTKVEIFQTQLFLEEFEVFQKTKKQLLDRLQKPQGRYMREKLENTLLLNQLEFQEHLRRYLDTLFKKRYDWILEEMHLLEEGVQKENLTVAKEVEELKYAINVWKCTDYRIPFKKCCVRIFQ
jgi:hypothetical protein